MIESRGRTGLRAVAIAAALLAASSVVLWPLAVLALPLLFWAACGGRLARWSASLVGSLVVFVVAEVVVWVVVEGISGSPPRGPGWLIAVAVVVVPPTLAAFLLGSRWARRRSVAVSGGGPRPAIVV